jgi:tetratricopeptide (TPR) repeat protein
LRLESLQRALQRKRLDQLEGIIKEIENSDDSWDQLSEWRRILQSERQKSQRVKSDQQKKIEQVQRLVDAGQNQAAQQIKLETTGDQIIDQQIIGVQRALRIQTQEMTPEIDRKIQSHLLEGISQYRIGNYQKALGEWNAILLMDPNHVQAKKYVANVLKKIEQVGGGNEDIIYNNNTADIMGSRVSIFYKMDPNLEKLDVQKSWSNDSLLVMSTRSNLQIFDSRTRDSILD